MFASRRASRACSSMIVAFSSPFIHTRRNRIYARCHQSQSDPKMSVLRRIADIANAAVTHAPPSPKVLPPVSHPLLSDTDLSHLTDAVARVTPEDLDVHLHDFIDLIPTPENLIGYVPVANQQNFTMAVFVMPPDSEIPLHDHANMYVVTKVLWGTLEVHEYEPLAPKRPSEADNIQVKRQPVSVVNSGNVRSLTPSRGNIHSFYAQDWTAVFDVLIPPYDSSVGRSCNYYTPLREQTLLPSTVDDDRFILKRSPCPDTYHTASIEYSGISLNS